MSTEEEVDKSTKEPKDLAKRVKDDIEQHIGLLDKSRGKDIIAVLGNTGSGKSATLDWLAGMELIATVDDDVILKDEEEEGALPIGIGSESMTKYPWSITIGDELFIDLPGFRDTGGMASDLVNAAFIKGILENAESVRVIFIVGRDEITCLKGECLKQLLTGLERMFGADCKNLVDLSLLVVTKDIEEDISQLREFLEEKMDGKYKKLLKLWSDRGRLFQVKKPKNGVICQEGKAQLLSALPYSGQKVSSLNVSALFSGDVKSKLEEIFNSLFDEEFCLFVPKPNEDLLSSLLDAIKKVKGDSGMDSFCENYLKCFESYLETVPAVRVLKPLSEDAFLCSWKKFQGNKRDTIKGMVECWEYKCQALSPIIQDAILQIIVAVCDKFKNELLERYSCKDVKDIDSGKKHLKMLKDKNDADIQADILRAVEENSDLKAIIDRDPGPNRDIYESVLRKFSENTLKVILGNIRQSRDYDIQIVQGMINKFELEETLRRNAVLLDSLKTEGEKNSARLKQLEDEIEQRDALVKRQEDQIKKLEQTMRSANGSYGVQIASSVTGLLSDIVKTGFAVYQAVKK